MSRIAATVVLLLVTGLATTAAAKDGPKKEPKDKVRKIELYLEMLGINHPKIREFSDTVKGRMEGDRNLRITDYYFDNDILPGRLVLHYEARRVSSKQFHLRFQPADSPNSEVVLNREGLMYHYKMKF